MIQSHNFLPGEEKKRRTRGIGRESVSWLEVLGSRVPTGLLKEKMTTGSACMLLFPLSVAGETLALRLASPK